LTLKFLKIPFYQSLGMLLTFVIFSYILRIVHRFLDCFIQLLNLHFSKKKNFALFLSHLLIFDLVFLPLDLFS